MGHIPHIDPVILVRISHLGLITEFQNHPFDHGHIPHVDLSVLVCISMPCKEYEFIELKWDSYTYPVSCIEPCVEHFRIVDAPHVRVVECIDWKIVCNYLLELIDKFLSRIEIHLHLLFYKGGIIVIIMVRARRPGRDTHNLGVCNSTMTAYHRVKVTSLKTSIYRTPVTRYHLYLDPDDLKIILYQFCFIHKFAECVELEFDISAPFHV